ncbi:hypothetical protein PJWF_00083 [Achromobacter phage JWF]|uniref:hypothetical protein n=1 Tax=Achromobacter phage JWF TaxID=1589748 RepID=UPI000588E538|nr:hypothetical protein AXJ13_gp105 [Achromobacter phage JWF]AJD82976.1 hypothetical protein PJWF_00083 [Achromobacter phage JWF]
MKAEINAEGQLVLALEITEQFLKDVFLTAIETPASNWFAFRDAVRIPNPNHDYNDYLSVVVEDWGDEDQAQSTKKITLQDLRNALPALLTGTMDNGADHANLGESLRAEILQAIINDDAGAIDADAADSILQAAFFGRIVYG